VSDGDKRASLLQGGERIVKTELFNSIKKVKRRDMNYEGKLETTTAFLPLHTLSFMVMFTSRIGATTITITTLGLTTL
jgi:hypothetical protein